jgi:hypothetical protein
MSVAEFVLTEEFLNKINKMLVSPKSKFILNSSTDSDKNMVIPLLKKSFNPSDVDMINNPKFINNVYFVTKTI